MKNLLFILVGFIAFSACKAKKADENTSKAPTTEQNTLKDYVITDLPGSEYKLAKYKNPEKKITDVGHILNGKKIGAWFTFYEDGRVLSVRNYIDDKIEGYFISMDPIGRVVQQIEYKNNYADGVATLYEGRRKVSETTYKQGKKDGIMREFGDANILQKESSYKADSLDGPMKFYNDEAKVTAEFEYKNGKKVSGGITK